MSWATYGEHTAPCPGSFEPWPIDWGYWPCPVCWRMVAVWRGSVLARHGFEIRL